MVQLPGLRRLRNFVEEFRRDFDCIQPRTRPYQLSISFDALEDNQGSSTSVVSTTSTTTSISNPVNVNTRLDTIIEVHEDGPASVTAHNLNISVDSEAHDQESPATASSNSFTTSHVGFISQASAQASDDDAVDSCTVTVGAVKLVEVQDDHPQESPASVIKASLNSSISHVSFISQASAQASDDNAVDSCTVTAEGATLAVPYPSPPETEDETVSESSDTEEDSKSKETVNAEDTVSDNDRPLAQSMTYQFHNCHAVYLNSHNAHGVKVKNAGNNTPQVTFWPTHSGNSSPSSSGSSASSCHGELCQSCRYEIVSSGFARCDLPPMLPLLPFQENRGSLLYPPGIPHVEIPVLGLNSEPSLNQFTEARQASMPPRNGNLPATIDTNSLTRNGDDTDSGQTPKTPGSNTSPGPYSNVPLVAINTSGHPAHRGFFPSFPACGAVQNALSTADISSRLNSHSPHCSAESTTNSSRDSLDSSNILLEHQLKCVWDTIQRMPQTNSAVILSPRAQRILIAVNALVSRETPGGARTSAQTRESLHSYSW